MNRIGNCGCSEQREGTLPGGALNASETSAVRSGIAQYVRLGDGNRTFLSFAEKYAYLRGKAACSDGAITFPCCSSTTQSCG
jgi:hypothetical protein